MMDHQQPPHQGGDGLLNLAPDDVAELLSPPAFAWSACSYTLTTTIEREEIRYSHIYFHAQHVTAQQIWGCP